MTNKKPIEMWFACREDTVFTICGDTKLGCWVALVNSVLVKPTSGHPQAFDCVKYLRESGYTVKKFRLEEI